MWKRGAARSSALSRAQAQLSGQRVSGVANDTKAELQDYMEVLTKRTNTLKGRQTPFQDLSDISTEDAESETKENVAVSLTAERPAMGSRFLKKVPQSVKSSQSPTLSKTLGYGRPDGNRSVSAQSAVLSRLALIENRIMSKKLAREGLHTDRDVLASDDPPVSVQSSSDLSTGGQRFLKKKTPASDSPKVETKLTKAPCTSQSRFSSKRVSLDSDEEDMRKLLGGSLDSPPPVRKSFLKSDGRAKLASPPSPSRRTPFAGLSRSPSPPSQGSLRQAQARPSSSRLALYSPVRAASFISSPSPTPPSGPSPRRTASPRSKFLRRSLSSLSARSDVRSLEELFPDVPDSEDVISEKSEGSDDFKLNIMNLDDLVPATLGEFAEPKTEGKDKETKRSRRRGAASPEEVEEFSHTGIVDLAGELLSVEEIQPVEQAVVYESDFESEIKTETEKSSSDVSERLGDTSVASEVQEDVSEKPRRRNRTRDSGSGSESRVERDRSVSYSSWSDTDRSKDIHYSSRDSYLRLSSSLSGTSDRTRTPEPPKSKSVREAAVQTHADGLSYSWSHGMAALGPSLGASYMDPTPIASHVVSADAVEALTAYSPAVFALNDMLRQQLALTRQFVDSTRHLHTSLVQSLGPEDYHYTTLQDTKEFIRRCKSPPLTMEQALEEVLQEMREYHYI
ncbi:uncharacterized protein C19orf44 homolog [Amia ocellicauda]|uniref:uncharacterized protein C19orf44 homolog n=1 Tax=Amia ocellicauda TaxID=2972642 RepID=UPI0034641C0B